jgi:formylglycine-generating enzyme required for sulfatase activity
MKLDEFRIGKYPVTNAEYRAFVEATKAQPPQHWSGGKFPDELAAHPVVYVSWHDALKYCEWLTGKLRAAGQLADKSAIRLPTEAEWEMATRGTADARFYPWGDEWDAAKCNTADGGPGQTTPVGQYSPAGDSPFGLADMAGNVWEWCLTKWRDNYEDYKRNEDHDVKGDDARVLRGGSWYNPAVNARCAYRLRPSPDGRFRDIGFRLVASPFVSGR